MNSRRKVSPEAEKVFNKYTKSPLVRRLNLEEACNMFQKEFGISVEQAPMFFRHFDADRNEQLSLWEFQHFYNIAGTRTPELIKKFNDLDKVDSDFLTKDEMLNILPVLAQECGKQFEEKDIDKFSKSAFGNNDRNEGKLSLLQFIDLLAKIKMYNSNTS